MTFCTKQVNNSSFNIIYNFQPFFADYVSPAAQRSMLKRAKAGKYIRHVESKAAYESNKPTEPTYKVDQTEEVFKTISDGTKSQNGANSAIRKKKKKKSQVVQSVEA